jgi:hypothetical protein
MTVYRRALIALATLALLPLFGGPAGVSAQDIPDLPHETVSQLDGTSNNRVTTSSEFAVSPLSIKQAADDVVVPAGDSWWRLTSFTFVGRQCLEGSMGDKIFFIVLNNDANNRPGNEIARGEATFSGAAPSDCSNTNSEFALELGVNVYLLRPGQRYWLSVLGQTASGSTRFVYWATRSTQTGLPAQYFTKFLEGCNNFWGPRTVCDGLNNDDADMAWSVSYELWTPTDYLNIPMVSKTR